jgi:hypothetical protein
VLRVDAGGRTPHFDRFFYLGDRDESEREAERIPRFQVQRMRERVKPSWLASSR